MKDEGGRMKTEASDSAWFLFSLSPVSPTPDAIKKGESGTAARLAQHGGEKSLGGPQVTGGTLRTIEDYPEEALCQFATLVKMPITTGFCPSVRV